MVNGFIRFCSTAAQQLALLSHSQNKQTTVVDGQSNFCEVGADAGGEGPEDDNGEDI